MIENNRITDQSTVNRKDEDQEKKILHKAKKQLTADAMFVFLFRENEEGVFVTRYLEGEFKKKYYQIVVEGALDELVEIRFGGNCGNSK